jgi:uncharacterized protein YkwD
VFCSHDYQDLSGTYRCIKCGTVKPSLRKKYGLVLAGIIFAVLAVSAVLVSYMAENNGNEHILVDRELLVNRALILVNDDRASFGLAALSLSQNGAAQFHADEILRTKTVSHWTTSGEKPYMTYAKYGGTGGIRQNIAFVGAFDNEGCLEDECEVIDPMTALERAHEFMMNDTSDSPWGSKNDILNPKFTHVSFGIAYDKHFLVLVQNFEYNYIELASAIGQDPENMRIIGSLHNGRPYNVSVYYDPIPSPEHYMENKGKSTYGFGTMVATIEAPLPPNAFYQIPTDHDLIIADVMSQNGTNIDIQFDMSSVTKESGVYTIVVWIVVDNQYLPVTTHRVFVMPEMVA